MAYLRGFDHDIFISYSHVDDQDSWVDTFQKKLEMELSRHIGRMGVVKIWDISSRKLIDTLKGHESSVWSVAFSPDGKTLASASGDIFGRDNTVKLCFAATDEEVERQRNR